MSATIWTGDLIHHKYHPYLSSVKSKICLEYHYQLTQVVMEQGHKICVGMCFSWCTTDDWVTSIWQHFQHK